MVGGETCYEHIPPPEHTDSGKETGMSVANRSRLTIIGKGSRKGRVLCRCECGTVKEMSRNFRFSGVLSCGCLRRELDAPPTPDVQAEIARRYKAGEGWLSLARQFGIGTTRVKNAIEASGCSMRSASQAYRVHAVDEEAFERDDPESHYWIGFLLADGCVQSKSVSGRHSAVILSLGEVDRDHIMKFRAFLKSESPIRTTVNHRSSVVPGAGRQCGIAINSVKLADSLIAHGVHPRKTATAAVPYGLADDLDFWRGYVDGDGWLVIQHRPKRWGSGWTVNIGVCGTREVCEGFVNFVTRRIGPPTHADAYRVRPIATIFRTMITGNQALKLAALLYTDAVVSLDRKKAKADEFAKHALQADTYRGEQHKNTNLKTDQVLRIRELYSAGGISSIRLAAQFGVDKATILNIIHRRTWSHI